MAKAGEGFFTVRENEEKVVASFHLLVHRSLPIGAFYTDGF